jgi:NADP-dependent 3-hydroxy acid dehydrogenase YdfG
MYFSNKIIWITGASSGIGKALAIALSKQHCKFILSSRNIASFELVKVACEHPQEILIIP